MRTRVYPNRICPYCGKKTVYFPSAEKRKHVQLEKAESCANADIIIKCWRCHKEIGVLLIGEAS